MRPVTLALKGINSFEQRQVIDFERLTRQGVFGIFGPTGSGKSSILDGITLALYGEVARESRNFINVNMDQAFVEFTFLIREGGERCYRVARSFRRDKKSQSVRTAGAKLTLMRGEMEEVLAEKAKEVNQACLEIIGLSKEDFFRTVILPQGRFFEFLKLEGVSRSKMLERLFHLEKYGDVLSARVNARLLNLRAKDQILQGNMDVQGEVSRETIERLSNEEQKLQKEWELQKEIFTRESAKIRRLEKVLEIQETLERARAQVKRLEKQREEIEKSKVRAGRARKANAVQAIWEETSQRETSAVLCVEKWKQAEKAWKMAKASYEELWGQWEIFLKEYQSQKTNLAVKEERLERLSLEWQKYKEQRQRLEKVQAEKDSINKELEGVKRKGEDRKNERDLLTKRRKESEETERQYQSGQVAAKILEDGYFCQKTCKRLTDEKKKLEQEWSRLKKEELEQEKEISAKNLHETQMTLVWLEVQKEQAEYQKLRKEHAKCVQQYRQKETSWNETKRKREEAQRVYEDKYREGLAAILAGQLKEGGPCPVCGSTHHPKKLQVSVDDVHLSGYRQERVRLEGEERRCLEELSACRRECEEKKEKAFQVHQLLKEKEEAYRKSVERITPRSWEMQSWSEEREREVKERADILQQNQKELDESYARTLANLESLETRTRSWETEWAKESERLQECRNKAGILDFEKAWEEERNLQEKKTKLRETILRLREEEERLEKEYQQSVQETSRLDRIYAKLEAEEELLREEIQKKKSEGLLDPEEELECVRYEKEKLEGGYQAHEKNVHTAKIKTDEWEKREKEEKRKADEAHIRLGESKKRLEEELEKSTFADVQTAKSYALEEEKIQVLEQNAQEYTDAWNLVEQKIKECEAKKFETMK